MQNNSTKTLKRICELYGNLPGSLSKRAFFSPLCWDGSSTHQITSCYWQYVGSAWSHLHSPCRVSDVTVKCLVSEDCRLPCKFQPDGEVSVEWFRQDVMIYKFEHDDDDDDDNSSSEERGELEQFAGRISMFPALASRGNATLVLKRSGLKDRGPYRCHVKTSKGEHNANVILRVEGEFNLISVELVIFMVYSNYSLYLIHVCWRHSRKKILVQNNMTILFNYLFHDLMTWQYDLITTLSFKKIH